jgi:formylmethanofuran dehydrogenase subunit B
VELADRLGACIDSTSSICHGPAVLAMQSVGLSGCTLGEIRNDADLLIFWGCNPAVSHPRFLARYAFPAGARQSRRMVVVDVRPTATSRVADLFLQVAPGADYEVLTALRSLFRGRPIRDSSVGGLPAVQLAELAATMRTCRFGVVLVGVGLTMSRGRDMNLSELFALVAELNQHTRFSALPMRGHGNVAGADQVLTWQTGYPFAVSLARGWPEYGPGEFSASDLLARHETDAALVVASDPVAHLPAAAGNWLREIPTIALDPNPSLTTSAARVVLPTACCGIDAAGTYYRMDGVPIRLRPVLKATRPTDEQILRQLLNLLGPASPGTVPAC